MRKESFIYTEEYTYTANERAWEGFGRGLLPIEKSDPTEAWIADGIRRSVKLNSESHKAPDSIPRFRQLPKEYRSLDSLQLSPRIVAPIKEGTTSDQLLSILLNSNIRKGNKETIDRHIPHLKNQIASRIEKEAPIEIVLPTLPFKNQNFLTSQLPLEQVDLGEHLLIAQMRDICLSIEQVYKPGAHITLLSDGIVYGDIFADGRINNIIQYRESARKIRNDLKLHKKVSIIDMAWIINNDPEIHETREQIKNKLLEMEEYNEPVKEGLQALRHGMIYNIPTEEYSFDEYMYFLYLREEQLPADLLKKTTSAAVDYASFLLAMQHRQVVSRSFPDAIRGTVHPKDVPQLPLHLVNRKSVTFPYNGVPVVSHNRHVSRGNLRSATRIMRFYDLLRFPEAKEVYREGEDTPFYYSID